MSNICALFFPVQFLINYSLFCSVTNLINFCAIGPIKLVGDDTVFSRIPCFQGQHLTIFLVVLFHVKQNSFN